jgi:hypothetical protein
MKPINELSDDEWAALVHEAATLPRAPAPLVRSVLELWRDHRPAPAVASGVRRWVAALVQDSWSPAQQTALGLRDLPSDVRHLLYAGLGRDIDLRIAPLAEGYCLSGQHLGPDAQGSVELWPLDRAAATPVRSAPLDTTGEFSIDGVQGGIYVLTLRLDGDEIMLPPIDIGAPASARGP